MIVLKLFDFDEPERVLESRTLCEGALTLGRDPGPGGWTLDDPQKLISRAHCVLTLANGRVAARDLSSNGVRLLEGDRLLPHDEDAAVEIGQTLRLGRYGVRLEEEAADATIMTPAASAGGAAATVVQLAPISWASASASSKPAFNDYDSVFSRPVLEAVDLTETTAVVPTDWGASEPAPSAAAAAQLPDAALLEAFCAGAKLDLSHFAGQDPREAMEALGQVYRQMVLGLSDLMSERVTVKAAYRMNRTIIRGENNNVFKWAGAQRVAVDLLRPPSQGFLRGPEAVNECFADLKKHVLCVMAGLRASVGATLDGLDPAQMKGGDKGGLFGARSGREPYKRLHAEVAASVMNDPDGPVNRAFRDAYERRLHELDGEGAASADAARLSAAG